MSNTPPPPYSTTNFYEPKIPIDIQGSGFPPPPQFNQVPGATNQPPPVIVHRIVQARTALFGPLPVEIDCPYCHNHIVTHTSRVPGALPWIIMTVCFVLGFFLLIPWCLCCIPFCVDSCLDVLHTCPSCKRLVGRFARL